MLDTLKEILNSKFSSQITWEDSNDWTSIVVPAAATHTIVEELFNNPELSFQFLTDLTAVHYPERKGEELCVVYHLHQLVKNFRLRIKAYVPIEQPNIPSITNIFSGANWMERETYDFYGIIFDGHPELNRILNADEMDYFPMRKEYPMEDPTRMDKDDEMFGRGNNF